MISIVLYRPEMPANSGNIMRLCVNIGARLHFIGPLPFFLDDQRLRRAGLDYMERSSFTLHTSFAVFMQSEKPGRLIAATSHGSICLYDFSFMADDFLIFGSETSGLGPEVFEAVPAAQRIRIPMARNSRCLNLANAVSVCAFEAWRQLGLPGAVGPAVN